MVAGWKEIWAVQTQALVVNIVVSYLSYLYYLRLWAMYQFTFYYTNILRESLAHTVHPTVISLIHMHPAISMGYYHLREREKRNTFLNIITVFLLLYLTGIFMVYLD